MTGGAGAGPDREEYLQFAVDSTWWCRPRRVCELTPAFDLSQPTISHHLKLLRQAGLIDCERRGTWVYYWVLPGVLNKLAASRSSTQPAGAPA